MKLTDTQLDNVAHYVAAAAQAYGRNFITAPVGVARTMLERIAEEGGATHPQATGLNDTQLVTLYTVARGKRPWNLPSVVAKLLAENKETPRAPMPPAPPMPPVEAPRPPKGREIDGMDKDAIDAFIANPPKPLGEGLTPDEVDKFSDSHDLDILNIPTPTPEAPRNDLFAPVEGKHAMLPVVLAMLQAGVNPYLVGHAGTGKTKMAEQLAEALGVTLYCQSSIEHSSELIGFRDMRGDATITPFKEAFTKGKALFFFDEMDNSDSSALTCFNAALANAMAMFPDGMQRAAEGLYFMGSGNTNGDGSCMIYNRAKLDGATRDRFAFVKVDYDPKVEAILAKGNTKWMQFVQASRHAAFAMPLRGHVIGPRATEQGAKLIAAGMPPEMAADMTIYNKISETDGKRLRDAAPLSLFFR